MSISDRIVVMKAGVVRQNRKAQEVHDDPVNLFCGFEIRGTPPISISGENQKQERSVSETRCRS